MKRKTSHKGTKAQRHKDEIMKFQATNYINYLYKTFVASGAWLRPKAGAWLQTKYGLFQTEPGTSR
jgi:hypothetical protein